MLLDVGSHNNRNLGAVAAMQATAERLRSLWSDSSIQVLTDDPEGLAKLCPDVSPVSAHACEVWFDDRSLGNRWLPAAVGSWVSRLTRMLRRRAPQLLEMLLEVRMLLGGRSSRDLRSFLDAVDRADVVAGSGQPLLNKYGVARQKNTLDLLELAARAGKLTAMFALGLGPLEDVELRKKAESVLPMVNVVALREGRMGPGILQSLGVSADRVFVTGDDCINLAYRPVEVRTATAIGVNFRVDHTTALKDDLVQELRPILQECARRHGAELVPVPIAINPHGTFDAPSIRALLEGFGRTSDAGCSLTTPAGVIAQIGACRVVLTAAYHAAVFAVSQGIPVVCLGNTRYSRDRFLGLASQFGTGVYVVDSDCIALRIVEALDAAWAGADDVRPALLAGAVVQMEAGAAAYGRLGALWEIRQSAGVGRRTVIDIRGRLAL